MNPDVLYLPIEKIQQAAATYPTPFFLYEQSRIQKNCERIKNAFEPRFKKFIPLYAVKANPNPSIVKIILDQGFGLDCSSLSESWLANYFHASGMHTGNYVTREELAYVLEETHLILNLDDESMLSTVAEIGIPEMISFRINPGMGEGSEKSNVLAGPDAKYGIPWEKAATVYAQAKASGITKFGIHMMTGSNVRDAAYFGDITKKLLTVIGTIKKETGIDIEIMNIGGGFGVPYRPEEETLDMDAVAQAIRAAYDEVCPAMGIQEPALMIEPGRFITADAGWLVGTVTVIKDGYKKFVGIDASCNDMPRPSIYGAYHHVTILTNETEQEKVSVVGSICENNDQFVKDIELPVAQIGDLVAVHNSGGHGYAMGHNYNGKPRHAEYLVRKNGSIEPIRRAETTEDLFRTAVFPS